MRLVRRLSNCKIAHVFAQFNYYEKKAEFARVEKIEVFA